MARLRPEAVDAGTLELATADVTARRRFQAARWTVLTDHGQPPGSISELWADGESSSLEKYERFIERHGLQDAYAAELGRATT